MLKLNLAKNSLFNILAYLISSGLWIILIPFIINHLGEELYGIWTIGNIVISASNLLNLGMPAAITREAADALGKKQGWMLRWVIRATDLFIVLICSVIGVAVLVGGELIVRNSFGVAEPAKIELTRHLLPWMVVLSCLYLLGLSRKAILDGFQEVYRSSQITTLGRVLNVCITVPLILAGRGIWSLFFANLAENVLLLILFSFFSRRYLKVFDYTHPAGTNAWQRLRRAIGYGVKLQVSNLLTFGVEVFYKSLISNQLGLATLGQFQVVWRLIQVSQGFLIAALRPIFAASSLLFQQNERQHLWAIFVKFTRYAFLLSAAVFAIAIPFGGLVFELWIGHVTDFQLITFQMLCLWMAASTLTAPGFFYLMGAGHSGAIILIQGSSALISVLIALLPQWLSSSYPWIFVGLSYALGGMVGLGVTLYFLYRVFDWSPRLILKNSTPSKALLLSAGLAGVAIWLASWNISLPWQILFLALTSLFCAIIIIGAMPGEDRNQIWQWLQRKLPG